VIIQPRHFVRFIDGRAGDKVVIAFLPGYLGGHLKTLQTDISLRRDYALKLIRHGVNYQGFDEIQNTIEKGYCLQNDPLHLYFLYVREMSQPEIYFLLIKTDKMRQELWLVTFHRIRQKQFDKRLLKRFLLREHGEDEFMG